jgi:hypothetical protein
MIEKLEKVVTVNNVPTPETLMAIVNKLEEVIEAINDIYLVFPNVKKQADMRRDFERQMTKPNEPGYDRANND